MDGKTDRIHAVVKKDELEIWEAELKEHSTYYMYNFKVVANDGQYQILLAWLKKSNFSFLVETLPRLFST